MSGPQFIHLQTFSRKPNPAGQSVDQVFRELIRDPEYAKHVENPEAPVLIDGLDPSALIERHDAMVEAAGTEVRIKGKVKRRAIRKDRHTLMTAVASYPVPWDEIDRDPEARAAMEAWRDRNVAFFKRLFGDRYMATYEHGDEAYPHLHIYALPEGLSGVDATLLHPGKNAKAKAMTMAEREGKTPREVVASGNLALKEKMRTFQDLYYKHVGEPSGLLRIGPRRQRLSRKDYIAQKHAAQLRSTSSLEVRSAELAAKEKALKAEADALGEKVNALQERESQLNHLAEGLAQCVAFLRSVIDTVGKTLGFSSFASIADGLDKLGNYADAVRKRLGGSEDIPEEAGSSPM